MHIQDYLTTLPHRQHNQMHIQDYLTTSTPRQYMSKALKSPVCQVQLNETGKGCEIKRFLNEMKDMMHWVIGVQGHQKNQGFLSCDFRLSSSDRLTGGRDVYCDITVTSASERAWEDDVTVYTGSVLQSREGSLRRLSESALPLQAMCCH